MEDWNPWAVKPNAERDRWELTPLHGVGPLAFGMNADQVAVALGVQPADLRGWEAVGYSVQECGVHLYFVEERLAAIAGDMRTGPQITLDGVDLVAQVPSVMEQWLQDYLAARDLPFYYGGNYEPGSLDLGLYLRVQRAGDHLLTRPLMVNAALADDSERIPRREWSVI
ncbi:hypothetical protein [Actinomadura harenae]|uniref:Uncharacterized protein n=1 Tax=Actinomadura harenae TaxID=2483351 RepID=A0A3M2LKK8_9ACTN|nr:hypothetical protein [Actinomadura harenae]RMI38009.1 hypothetical protein EBO15_34255 [Actinomadura harenae]